MQHVYVIEEELSSSGMIIYTDLFYLENVYS